MTCEDTVDAQGQHRRTRTTSTYEDNIDIQGQRRRTRTTSTCGLICACTVSHPRDAGNNPRVTPDSDDHYSQGASQQHDRVLPPTLPQPAGSLWLGRLVLSSRLLISSPSSLTCLFFFFTASTGHILFGPPMRGCRRAEGAVALRHS